MPKWTKENVDTLISMNEEGYTHDQIAEKLERSANSIKYKLGKFAHTDIENGRDKKETYEYYGITEDYVNNGPSVPKNNLEKRVRTLEKKNRELEQKIDALTMAIKILK